jgi:transcriptional regulator with XRE-family HTH domain
MVNRNDKYGGADECMDGDLEKRKIRGRRLRRLRLAAGITQEELGTALGLKSGSSHISQIEGGTKGMSLEQTEKIAKLLGVHPIVIATGRDYTNEQLDFLNQCCSVLQDPDPSVRNVMMSICKARVSQQ